ncbi:MAG: TRAP transporter large permease subunit, partial [Pseudomonadales bacterium]|nr:TRAP transporter large permease subunit [Pseudomonadales bacterium]
VLLSMGVDPVWLGVMIAVNLQTSFLTPPFGFALFYLRGVAPETIATSDIYRGVVPFIGLQLLLLSLLVAMPKLATWLPNQL